ENGDGIYVNIDNTDMTNSTDTVSTLVHEQARHEMAQNGQAGGLSRDDQTTLATNRGDRAGEVWEAYSGLAGQSTQGSSNQQDWNNANRNSGNVQRGTQQIAAINNNDLKARQLNRNEASMLDKARDKINDSDSNDADKQLQLERLDALACAEVQCAAGVSENDPLYGKLSALQAEGESIKATEGVDILATLDDLGVSTVAQEETEITNNFLATTRTEVSDEQQFQYGAGDVINDGIDSAEKLVAKADGAAQAAGGVAGVVGGGLITGGGVAGCGPSLGISCAAVPAGVTLATFGGIEAKEGLEKIVGDHEYKNGQRVQDSFSSDTHQGDRNASVELAKTVGVAVVESAAAKVGLKQAGDVYDKVAGKTNLPSGSNGSVVSDVEVVDAPRTAANDAYGNESNVVELSNRNSNQNVDAVGVEQKATGTDGALGNSIVASHGSGSGSGVSGRGSVNTNVDAIKGKADKVDAGDASRIGQTTEEFAKKNDLSPAVDIPTVKSAPTRRSVRAELDKLPDGQGANFDVRQHADGSFSAVRKDVGATPPIKVTENGNLASPIKTKSSATDKLTPQEKGRILQERRRDEEIAKGNKVTEEVTLELSDGKRTRVDLFVEEPSGNVKCVECKNGPTAKLTDNQKQAERELPSTGATTRGGNADGTSFGRDAKLDNLEFEIDRRDIEE
ncbi:hypothetical protein, partial [Bacterioplanoides pacificum]